MTAALAEAPAELVHTVRAACAIARLALPLVPADEPRPRRAIEAAEAWAREPGSMWAKAALAQAAREADRSIRARVLPGHANAACARAADGALDAAVTHTAQAWADACAPSRSSHGHNQWALRLALVDDLSRCADAILAAYRTCVVPHSPLVAFLRAPTRDGALVALDWLREGRGHASPPVWALAWLYAHVPGVAP